MGDYHTRGTIYVRLRSTYYFAVYNFIENFLALFAHDGDIGLFPPLKHFLYQRLVSINVTIV